MIKKTHLKIKNREIVTIFLSSSLFESTTISCFEKFQNTFTTKNSTIQKVSKKPTRSSVKKKNQTQNTKTAAFHMETSQFMKFLHEYPYKPQRTKYLVNRRGWKSNFYKTPSYAFYSPNITVCFKRQVSNILNTKQRFCARKASIFSVKHLLLRESYDPMTQRTLPATYQWIL